MKKLVFIINDHAEVGKSSLGVALRGFLRAQSFDCALAGIVGDEESDGNLGIYDRVWNAIEDAHTAPLIDLMDQHDVVLCDVESGLSPSLIDIFEGADLDLVLGELDVELTIVIPEVESEACHEEIVNIAETFSDAADYIVARVTRDEGILDMEAWEDSEAIRVMDYMGAVVVEVPEITSGFLDLLEAHDLSLPRALDMRGDSLPRYVSQPLVEWIRYFHHEIGEAADYLFPRAKLGIRRMADMQVAA